MCTVKNIMYAKNAMHYMYSRANGNSRSTLRMYHALYFLPKRLNGESYLIFREQVLLELLQDVPITICYRM